MAREDYTGVPEQTPSLDASNDRQNIEASPADFGAATTQGLQQAGADFTKTADFYGEVAADNATNNLLDARDKLMYGDPSKTVIGPDGTPTADTGFLGLRGAAAMKAAPEVSAQLDEAIKDQQDGLETPMARQAFENQSRRYRAQTLEQIGSHSDEQQKVWATSTNQTSADLAINQAARSPTDPATIAQSQEQIRQAYAKNAALAGTDPRGAILKADQDLALARIRSLVGSDDPAQREQAQTVLDQNAGVLGSMPNYDQIVGTVKTAVINSQLGPATDSFVHSALAGAQASVGSGAPTAPFVAKGAGYDRVTAAAQKAGASPEETDLALKTVRAESSGNPDAVNGSHSGVFQYGPNGPRSVEDQTSQFITDARANKATLTAAGIAAPTESDLYLMHQQGPAGGKALLTAPPETGAIAALTPAYRGNVAVATEAIAGNIGMPYKTPEQRTAANAVAATMTAGQFRDQWAQKFGGGVISQYPTTSDALRATMPQQLDSARSYAEKTWPNYPDVQERFVSGVERGLQQTITQNDQQYTVDTHIVQSAVEANKPINEQELAQTSPEVAAAWSRMQTQNPMAAMGVERMFDANARGGALVYGSGFKDYLDRVTSPSTDPDHISNPAQLYPYVRAGADAPLTNSGQAALAGLTKLRGTPQGEAQIAQIKSFADQLHGQLTFSNRVTGVYDTKGEGLYTKAMAQILPTLEQGAKNGTLGAMLNPNSPDYVGHAALPFMRSQTEVMDDHTKYAVQTPGGAAYTTPEALGHDLSALDSPSQIPETVKALVKGGRLTPAVWQAYLVSQAPKAAPVLRAPAPAAAPTTSALTDDQARAKLKAEGINEPGL